MHGKNSSKSDEHDWLHDREAILEVREKFTYHCTVTYATHVTLAAHARAWAIRGATPLAGLVVLLARFSRQKVVVIPPKLIIIYGT